MGGELVGWYALPPLSEPGFNEQIVHDGLYVNGRCVAVVEAFFEAGPWYANAITTDGKHVRAGAMKSQAAAMDWCEERAGVRPIRAHPTTTTEQEDGRHDSAY